MGDIGTARVVPRVVMREAAAALLRRLRDEHGPILLHQSGGCCDGSVPISFPVGGFRVGDHDVLLGLLDLRLAAGEVSREVPEGADAVPVWIARAQFPAWRWSRIVLDTEPGPGAGFSLDETLPEHLVARSHIVADHEVAVLDAQPPITGLAFERGARPVPPSTPLVVGA